MPRPLSNDLRIRIVKAVDAGASRNTTVKRFGVSISTVVKLMQAVRATGSHEPKRMGGYRPVILEAHRDKVMGLVARRPDATLKELGQQLKAVRIAVGRSTLARYLNRIGLRLKKLFTPANRTGRTSRRRAKPCVAISLLSAPPGWCSSMRPDSPPTWCGATDAARPDNGFCARHLMAIGAPPPSSPPCAVTGSARRSPWTAR